MHSSIEERIISQLMVKAQEMVSLAFQLEQKTEADLIATQRTASLFIMGLIVVMGVVIAGSSMIIAGRILTPIARLHQGVETVRAGNLDVRVGGEASNELGELARAFDAMTENLQRVMTQLAHEVSVRQQVERALQKSEHLFRHTFESIPNPALIWSRQADDQILLALMNQASMDMSDGKIAEFLGVPVEEFFEHAPEAAMRIRQTLQTGESQHLERPYTLRTTGEQKWIVADYVKATEDSVLNLITDMTERKQEEQALQASEESLRALLNALQESAFLMDTQGVILAANETIAARMGMPVAQFVGTYAYDMLPADIADQRKRRVEQVFETGLPVRFEDLRYGRYIDNAVYPVFDQNGTVSRVAVLGVDITERKQIDESLRIRNRAMESSLTAMAIGDLDGRLTYVNPAFLQMWDYAEAHEVLGKPVTRFWHKREKARQVVETVRSQGNWRGELVAQKRSGDVFDVLVSTNLVNDEAGHPLCVTGSFVDITDRKRMERALRESEERHRELFETSRDGIVITDLEGRFVDCNRAYLDLLGYGSLDELSSRAYQDLTPPEYHEFEARIIQEQTLARGYCDEYEKEYVRKTGERVSVSLRAWLRRDPNKQPVGMWVIVRDITDRKKAEEALRESEEKFRMLSEESPNMIFINAQGQIVYVNRKCEELMGYAKEEFYASSFDFLRLIARESVEQVQQNFTLHRQGVHVGPYECTLLTKAGQRMNVIVTTAIIAYEKRYAILAIVTDITDRKQAEEELRQAKNAAEAANQVKSQFLANMSHELRTPLNAILGYAQLLIREHGLTEHQAHAIETIHRSGEHLLELINDVLDLSKIEAGKIELYPVEFLFLDALHTLVEVIRFRAQQQGITFAYTPDPDLPTVVYADKIRLRQVILNLLSNAVKFTPQGTVTFQVRVLHRSQTPSDETFVTLRFQVEDTGIGIAPDHLEEVFLPFQQVSDPHFRAEGTGLGLAISQRLVRMMGGELQVQSAVGQGSVFWFDVRLQEMMCERETDRLPSSSPSQTITGYRTQEAGAEQEAYALLLVDDYEDNRTFLSEMLIPLGFEVLEAASGTEALAKSRECHPDLILMDLVMPDMDGVETFQHLQADPTLDDIRVCAVSADVSAETRQKCLDAGFDGFLVKPITIDALLESLQQLLPIQWVYADEAHAEEAQEGGEEPVNVLPPADMLQTLSRLARRGNLQEIRAYLDTIDQTHPECRAFTSPVHAMSKGYQINRIREYITHALEQQP
ncbi:PAS domain S-box protein [candidate division KSB3 bacterium]|uniref:histidine kinase n=1 Tax=candidate division KSB3 bacterium TaxID=2044937 RepID=A0A9D5K0B5_9BACT|nr:PAS domain S-box protein [candidate division KSB3 bacterium]MBD3327056.1 PAS domain S-box protein [candidate division KSB3 bacterium]